jgi:hypothetical protein
VQSDAAIVTIDIGPSGFNIAGPNGNVQLGYGWLEVRWTGSTNQFQILAGAYEDQVGVPILTPTAIPEPASALSTMGMLASGLLIRRRKLAA